MASRRIWLSAATAAGLVVALAACAPSGTSNGSADDPIELTFWGSIQGQQAQVDLWNDTHPEIQVDYVEQGGDADLTSALQNATAAGNAPDLFETPRGYTTSFLVDGISQDVSSWFDNDDSTIAESAFDFVHVGDVVVGIPFATNPTFNAVNTATFDAYGFDAPTTWSEFLEQATAMQPDGVKSMNLPGEDPSYLRDLATQFGAQWWSTEGDAWRVGFDSPESLAAGEILQQAIDADIVSNHTYIEWDALMQFFSSGKLSQFTTSTWQLPIYEANFQSSVGDWELAPYPAEDGEALVSPSYFNVYGVGATTEHPEAAVEFARWLATDPEATALISDTAEGASVFPVVADSSGYIDALLPSTLLGDHRGGAASVVEGAIETSRSMSEGPDQVAATEELVDWWARALTKEVTVAEVLAHMQEWTVADLEAKNIDVVD